MITPTNLPSHMERVVNEKQELDEKLNKLRAFFETEFCMGLPFEDRALLKRQEVAMTEYSDVLAERIAQFFATSVAHSDGL